MRLNASYVFMATALLLSCGAKQATENQAQAHVEGGLEHYVYKDSTDRVDMSIDVTVPVAADSASTLIRDSLIKAIDNEYCYIWGDSRVMPSYKGKDKSLKAIIDYYGSTALKVFNKGAEDDYKERMQYVSEDTTITPDERQQMMSDTPRWEYDTKIVKEDETTEYIAFLHESFQYLGGAHGGIGGSGTLTFNAKTGKKIEKFFINGAEKQMQKFLIAGLTEYFSENSDKKITKAELMDYLQVENGYIPLPSHAPSLSKDGLVLTYQQYEIASYAAGMPSFTIPYKDVMPFLTEEVKALIKPSK